jgi:hypothetical protein
MALSRMQPPIIAGREHKVETLAAPVGGINARDGISIMPPTDAVNLINWAPDTYGVRCRKGFREWAINFPTEDPIQSIMSWVGKDTAFPGGSYLDVPSSMPGKLFAANNDAIFDVTDATDAPVDVQTLSGGDNAGWFSSTMLVNVAGSYLCACSEADGYMYFDGTTWTVPTMGGGAGQIANVSPTNLCFTLAWKKRLWFVESDSTSAWYLPTEQITGSATEFDFGANFANGGHLAALARWTIDAGEGIDDYLVAISSMGDVAVYKGTDPSSSSTFGLVGVWNVGQVPVGRRFFVQYGGDLVILSTQGIYPLSFVTRGGAQLLQASGQEYSSAIRSPLGADIRASYTTRGWQLALHPGERMLLCSVPDYASFRNKQYAMSTVQNKWFILSDIPTLCYGQVGGYIFAGTNDGRVILAFSGFFDEVPYGESLGNGIRGIIQQAFSSFGTPAIEKQYLMVRPCFLTIDIPGILVDINVNYAVQQPFGTPPTVAGQSNVWNVGEWDVDMWGGQLVPYAEWLTVNGLGFAAGLGMVTTCVGDTVFVSSDYMFKEGGPFG